MAMPEATVNKNYLSESGENEIGATRKLVLVQAITIALRIQQSTNAYLDRGVLAFHRLHGSPSGLWRLHHALRIGVDFDSRAIVPARRIRVVRSVSGP